MATKRTSQTFELSVTPEELEHYEKAAFEAFRRELTLPGFRQGTVGADVAKRHIPQERVFADAIERAIADIGTKAVEPVMERIVGQPDVKVTKVAPGNPLEFSVTVELLPEVDVTNWRQLNIPFAPKAVGEEDITKAMEQIRGSRAKTQAVARSAQKDDVVHVDFETRKKGVKIEGGESKDHPVHVGADRFIPGFEEAIVGMNPGETKTVTLKFPKDWPVKTLAGEEAEFTITAQSVHERILPELDDAFAQSLGQFSGLEELQQNVREGLHRERLDEERQRVRSEALERLGKPISERDIPEMVLEQEIARIRDEMRERIERGGLSFEDYLTQIGKDEKEFAKDWREGALERVRASLVLRALASHENVSPDAKEVEERVDELVKMYRNPAAPEQRFDADAVRSYTESTLRNELVLKLLDEVFGGEATNE
jgi:trigger factor